MPRSRMRIEDALARAAALHAAFWRDHLCDVAPYVLGRGLSFDNEMNATLEIRVRSDAPHRALAQLPSTYLFDGKSCAVQLYR